MKIKTSELIGPALDWAVAECEGVEVEFGAWESLWLVDKDVWSNSRCVQGDDGTTYHPSRGWKIGGPIIKRERISVCWEGTLWVGSRYNETEGRYWAQTSGPTPLVAAMRCYVASKLGNEVDVPKKLIL